MKMAGGFLSMPCSIYSGFRFSKRIQNTVQSAALYDQAHLSSTVLVEILEILAEIPAKN